MERHVLSSDSSAAAAREGRAGVDIGKSSGFGGAAAAVEDRRVLAPSIAFF